MTNFDFLLSDPQFHTFADAAVLAERLFSVDASSSAEKCRMAMEYAVKWMYSVDKELPHPWQDKLYELMGGNEFRSIVGEDIWKRMDFIRLTANASIHKNKKVSEEQALLCLENLYIFLDFVACCYGTDYKEGKFDPSLPKKASVPAPDPSKELNFQRLLDENKKLKEQLTGRREEQQKKYTPKPLELSEYATRKLYIDTMLADAGWTEGKDWVNEVKLEGMPNQGKTGYADYVLYGDDGSALAVIEAKKTCVDVSKGRQQAKLYADLLEKKYHRRPVIFLTNGFETRISDGVYPERKCAAFYSKRDLEKLFNLRYEKTSLKNILINKDIADRYYQDNAVKAVCEAFGTKNRRKALLVMATGSGKTRTVIALCDVLLRHNWVKNILFLADRNALVTQAKRSFHNLLPNLSVSNLCEEKKNVSAHCIFSTYNTMMNCIDTETDEQGRVFTCGHFDLIICDEAHRSIYNKYQDIFNYFDAPLVGLTATPKDEIDKNTYDVFQLENGIPTYGYELAQAVRDGFLVDFMSVETKLKFIEQGIVYDELSEDDREQYETTFRDENGELPEQINSAALNEWVFNEDTIRQVLHILMEQGLKIDYGNKIGKSIIFAKNHRHAEKILEVFGKEYPHLTGYAQVIDNYINYAQTAIDTFSDPKKLPQIAISVDMLDTGIDVPEVLNLVFFKKVLSKSKFWQMIGRGTRLCEGLLDGEDKTKFYIFDFCGNFEFFRMNQGKATANQMALQGALFSLKAQIAFKLQDMDYQTPELMEFREGLVEDMLRKVRELDRNHFAVKQHLKYVERFSDADTYQALSYADTLEMKEEVAPLLIPDDDEAKAMRFDALVYGIELAYLVGKTYTKARNDLVKKVRSVAGVSNIPAIIAQSEFIDTVLHTDYLERAGINEFEEIRKNLRDLIKYIPVSSIKYDTNFADEIMEMEWNEAELENDDLKNYKEKAEFYIRQHMDNTAIKKLRENIPLTKEDMELLQNILWKELGTEEDYKAEYGEKPLGEFVREIVGMDMHAAKEAFSEYLGNVSLDSRQIYFVNQIVEYIVHNGILKDFSVFQESPFTDRGSIVEVFSDPSVWMKVKGVIDIVNRNASAL